MPNIIERFDRFTNEIKENIATELSIELDHVILLHDTISIAGNLELVNTFDGMEIKVDPLINRNKIKLIQKVSENWDQMAMNFYHYLHVKNVIGEAYIDTPRTFVNSVIEYIDKRNSSDEYEFLLPFKERIRRNYDNNSRMLDKLIESYEYAISFSFHTNKNKFTYYINKISSDGSSEIIRTDEVHNFQTKSFVESIMFYGNLKI